ncbi:MAG: hypothetical protein IT373_19720 [Polyangiaceae bacterium]|nr:hypothetical protein [Polyangiaceae bacterium]
MRSISRAERAARAAPLVLVLAVVALPVVTLLAVAFAHATPASAELLGHLLGTVVPAQTAQGLLAAGGAALLGAALAAGGLAGALFDFPGRAVLDRALLVPLLLPTWFVAVVHREVLGARGVGWLGLCLGVGAAPLFHLLGGAALRALPGAYVDVLRLSGRARGLAVARHLVPLAFPALGAAAALAALAGWSDAPAARILAVPTLAVGMLDQWSAREDASAGALFGLGVGAVGLLACAVLLYALGRIRWQDDARLGASRSRRIRLRGISAALPWLLAAPQLVLGVVLPWGAIAGWAAQRFERVALGTLGGDAAGTLLCATAGTLLAAALGLPILHARAFAPAGRLGRAAAALALVPFALPAAVLAAAVLWMSPSGARSGPAAAFNATLLPLVMALGVHLCAVFVATGLAGLRRQGREHVALLLLLGHTRLRSLGLLRPFLSRPVAAAAAFVFLECIKDVQLTTVLSPFGFSSISARVLELAQTERMRDCAVWMLGLGLIGLYPLMTLARTARDPEEPEAEPC